MGKEIRYNGGNLFNVVFDDINAEEEICTIDNIGKDRYGLYNHNGDGFLVGMLDTIDIVELLVTGSIERSDIAVKPLK